MTGNFALCTAAVMEGRARLSGLLRSWLVTYSGNFIGAVLLALAETRDEACSQYETLGFGAEHVQTFRDNYARAALGVLREHGFTPRSFEEELTTRTSARFVEAELRATSLGVLPPETRAQKRYRITVGFADEEGTRHVLGSVEVSAAARGVWAVGAGS